MYTCLLSLHTNWVSISVAFYSDGPLLTKTLLLAWRYSGASRYTLKQAAYFDKVVRTLTWCDRGENEIPHWSCFSELLAPPTFSQSLKYHHGGGEDNAACDWSEIQGCRDFFPHEQFVIPPWRPYWSPTQNLIEDKSSLSDKMKSRDLGILKYASCLMDWYFDILL